jgi:VWFA-related protein
VAQADPTVSFLKPQERDVLVGKTEAALLLQEIPDDRVDRVEVLFDGRRVGTLTEPPWRLTFDAGDEISSHTLIANVVLRDGTRYQGRLVTTPLGVDRVDVRLVDLAVTVTDPSGDPIEGLERSDFRVFDQGQRVEIDRWDSTPPSLAAALVIDTSLSMQGEKIQAAKRAAEEFLEELQTDDKAAVMAFSDEARTLLPLSAPSEKAYQAVETLQAEGGTALYDALHRASKDLTDSEPRARRVAVLLSDGRDEAASGLEPGSFHTLEEAIKAAHDKDVVVFTIGFGHHLDEEPDFTGRYTTEEILMRLASSTGGRYLEVRSSRALERAFRDIMEELRHQYQIAYVPPKPLPGQTWREIRVEVDRPEAEVRTRDGYYVK